MNSILVDQNKPEMIRLLKAQRVAYTQAKKIQNFEWTIQIISLLSPIIGLLALQKQYEQYALVMGAIFTIIYVATYFSGKNKTNEGARIQEQFDIALFGLAWNTYLCKQKVEANNIIKFARRYEKNDLENWYSKEILPSLRKNIAVLLCQNSNLIWDCDLRKTFVRTIFWITVSYILVYSAYLIYADKTFSEALLLFVPVTPSLVYLVINMGNQHEIIKRKTELKDRIHQLLENFKDKKKEPTKNDLRNIQNLIFIERNKPEKIHNWFYRIHKNEMEQDMDECVKILIFDFNLNS